MSCTWVKRQVHGPVPATRQGHAVAVVGKNAYVFGGSSGSGYGETENSDPVYLNDLFLLKVGLQVSWERMRQLGDVPCGRDGHSLNAVGSVLYLFGGSNFPEAEDCLDDLYAYDIGTLSWELCPTQGRQPKTLGQTTVAIRDTLYVFGGIYRGEANNKLYMLNTGNLTWTPLVTSGQIPPPRCDHACTVIGEKFYISGGSGGEKTWFNDLYCFDTVTLIWHYINAQGHLPFPRSLHTICAYHDKDIYLFGGTNDSAKGRSPFNDVFKFNLSKSKWKKLHCEGPTPDSRLGHCAIIIYGQMIVFGGMNDERDFSDVVILQTRAAAKQLPPAMTGLNESTSSEQSIDSIDGPLSNSYNTNIPIPSRYQLITPTLNKPIQIPDLSDTKAEFVQRIEDVFRDLTAKYTELETQRELLKKSVEAFEEEKNINIQKFEQQQKELKELLEKHKTENEDWIQTKKEELEEERAALQRDRMQLLEEQKKLRRDSGAFEKT
ncbi:rho GTPase-activating protein gacHH isoform X1 [Nematostella vectensis]|uniref:rho GTPase-activating protein gacHH isoform X1 n=2 Tax=Nematostella vectensis TaxID=45351 RepID=UPI00207709ED|nr:rho GTPase-activating protein gacHH isoform X1 [Nematostella vectensis]